MRILFLLIFTSFAAFAADNLQDIDLEKIETETQSETKPITQTETIQKDTDVQDLEIEDLEEVYFKYNKKLKNSKRRVRQR